LDDDHDPKVVSLEERLEGRGKDHANRMDLHAEMTTSLQATILRMQKLGATAAEIAAQLEAAVRELRRKR
jgi:hypothetical protein